MRQSEPRLKVWPTGFDIGSDRSERDGWFTSLLFTSSISNPLLAVVPVGMWAKARVSLLSELAREAGEAQPVGNADPPYIHRLSW